MMKPDIKEIIKVCLTIGKKIIFYLPRTTMINEFYNILDDALCSKGLIYNHIFIV